jgi:thioredoxin 1
MLSLVNDQQFETALKSGKLVVADFYTDWCHSCKNLEPIISRLAQRFDAQAEFVKINADEQPEIATKYSVSAYPTIVIFKNGAVVEQIVGAYPESALKEIIENHL